MSVISAMTPAARWRAKNPEKARAASASWRRRNPERVKRQMAEYRIANRDKLLADSRAYSAAHPDRWVLENRTRYAISGLLIAAAKADGCIDCGESDPVVLDLDHVIGRKRWAVSQMRLRNVSALLNEISKCEVRCANCHRRVTARRRAA